MLIRKAAVKISMMEKCVAMGGGGRSNVQTIVRKLHATLTYIYSDVNFIVLRLEEKQRSVRNVQAQLCRHLYRCKNVHK
jgi:histidinol-phosphate/aromatic aminotransferase/cobyric acid decarboxylase-like protein